MTIIDNRLKPQDGQRELRRMEAASARQAKHNRRRDAKAHASWVMFWREIVQNPDAVFAEDRAENTAWNLWRAWNAQARKAAPRDGTDDSSKASLASLSPTSYVEP